MKQITVKVNQDKKNIMKETPEQRKERLRANFTYTRVVPNKKKKYNRANFKKFEY